MALSIGVKKGSQINIGGERIGGRVIKDQHQRDKLIDYTLKGGKTMTVVQVDGTEKIVVEYNGNTLNLTDKERIKLEEGVFVSCGLSNGKGLDFYGRLAFEAPRSVRIERIQAS
ncbi:hypothetical protein DLP3_137 [Stenotrophomonas phage vB_SmaS_DLP_3]|nr:hypothetical protein DLP3_137 [Stenotrophomonas phage vB_SmaS_DLP_3]